MPLAQGTYSVGPHNGAVHLRTKREGVASKVGHDLLLEVPRWSGQITAGGAQRPPGSGLRIELDLQIDSLTVLEGTGGAVGLSDADRREIAATAQGLLSVEQFPVARFASNRILASDDFSSGVVDGTLTLRGRSQSVSVTVSSTGRQSWRGTATVAQSAFGIKPYRAFFGALRLADSVAVEVTVDLAGG